MLRLAIYPLASFFFLGGSNAQPVFSKRETLAVTRQTQMPAEAVSGVLPVWSGGALVSVDDGSSAAPIIKAYDRSGKLISRVVLTIEGATLINVTSDGFARGLDGSFAIGGSAYSADSRGANFIAWISPDSKQQRIIRVSPFVPRRVTIATDGTIWAAGRELENGREDNPGHHVVRRFDNQGRLLGSWIPRSTLQIYERVSHPVIFSQIVAAKDRVGWFSRAAQKYIEFSLDGSIITRVDVPQMDENKKIEGMALCDNGHFFINVVTQSETGASSSNILRLDRVTNTWNSVETSERLGHLYGCDGTTIAMRAREGTHALIKWVEFNPQ